MIAVARSSSSYIFVVFYCVSAAVESTETVPPVNSKNGTSAAADTTNTKATLPTVLIPFGKFEATDQTENFASYLSSLRVEFKGFSAKGLKGKVQHEFSRAAGNKYSHAFWISGTQYKQKLDFEIGKEHQQTYNGTSFKYRYYQEPSQLGLHAVFHVPSDNPLPIEHLYTTSPEGFVLTYKVGDVIAKRTYKRIP